MVKAITLILIFLFLLLTYALIILDQKSEEEKELKLESVSSIGLIYKKDTITELCFAFTYSQTHNSWIIKSLTNVPCSDKVLKSIQNNK